MEKYYILFNCDEWKMHDSMKIVGVFDLSMLIDTLKTRINSKEYEFEGDTEDIDTMSIREINTSLRYGDIQEVEINEVLD